MRLMGLRQKQPKPVCEGPYPYRNWNKSQRFPAPIPDVQGGTLPIRDAKPLGIPTHARFIYSQTRLPSFFLAVACITFWLDGIRGNAAFRDVGGLCILSGDGAPG